MTKQVFTNNASSVLYGTLPIGGTTLVLASGTGERFPGVGVDEFFLITLYEKDEAGNEINIEVAKCTQRVADTLTIERDVEELVGSPGGLAYPSAVGKTVFVQLRWTAGSAAGMLQQQANLSDLSDASTARTNLGLGNVDNTADVNKQVLSATKLTTARMLSLTGDVTGSVSFDGTANAAITATVADDSHNHVIANVYGLQTALDGKVDLVSDQTVAGKKTFSQKAAFGNSASTAIADYAAEFRGSGLTSHASRTVFSQGTTNALAVSVQSSVGATAFTDFQWITRADGTLISTPLRLKYDGSACIPSMAEMNFFDTSYGIRAYDGLEFRSNTKLRFLTGLSGASTEQMQIANTGDVYLRGTGAIKLNVGTTAQRPATPEQGMLRFNSETGQWEGYAASAWGSLSGSSNSTSIVAMAALDVNCSLGTYFTKTIAGNSTFTFSNAPSGVAYAFTLELTHTSGTVTWPTSVKWPYNTAPTLTTAKTHLFTFLTDDGGTSWRGSALTNYTN